MATDLPPVIVDLMLAECVHVSRETQAPSVINVVNRIVLPKIPGVIAGLYVFMTVTEVYGPRVVRVAVLNGDDEEVSPDTMRVDLTELYAQVDPNSVFSYGIQLPNMAARTAGKYKIQVLCNGEEIAARYVWVAKKSA